MGWADTLDWGSIIGGVISAAPSVIQGMQQHEDQQYNREQSEASLEEQKREFEISQAAAAAKFKAQMHQEALRQLLEANQLAAANNNTAYANSINQYNSLASSTAAAAARAIRGG